MTPPSWSSDKARELAERLRKGVERWRWPNTDEWANPVSADLVIEAADQLEAAVAEVDRLNGIVLKLMRAGNIRADAAEARAEKAETALADIRKVLDADREGRTYEPLDIIRRIVADPAGSEETEG